MWRKASLRFTLWQVMVAIVILAIDFAVLSAMMRWEPNRGFVFNSAGLDCGLVIVAAFNVMIWFYVRLVRRIVRTPPEGQQGQLIALGCLLLMMLFLPIPFLIAWYLSHQI